jgi:hypothetical protein
MMVNVKCRRDLRRSAHELISPNYIFTPDN